MHAEAALLANSQPALGTGEVLFLPLPFLLFVPFTHACGRPCLLTFNIRVAVLVRQAMSWFQLPNAAAPLPLSRFAPTTAQSVTVEQDAVWFLNAVSADDADVVEKRQLLVSAVGEPDEMHHVGHHVTLPRRPTGKPSLCSTADVLQTDGRNCDSSVLSIYSLYAVARKNL